MDFFTSDRVEKDRKALEEASDRKNLKRGQIHRCNPEHPCRICGRSEVTNPAEAKKLDPVSVGDIFGPLPAHRYDRLKEVLIRAFYQAATGKGEARHGKGLPFEKQPMQTISQSLDTNAGLLYQAAKKAQESKSLDLDDAVFELLGAINYLAGAIIFLEDRDGK